MFGNLSKFEQPSARRDNERATSRLLQKELLLEKIEALDSDQTPSDDTEDSDTTKSTNSSSVHDIVDSGSEDSVKKLEKKVKRKKKLMAQRKEAREKRETELREREERLNSAEKVRSDTGSVNVSMASSVGGGGAGMGLNSNSDPAAINQVAEILRALKGKGQFTGMVPGSPGMGAASGQTSPSSATPQEKRRSIIQNKFKAAVRKSKVITKFNKVADEGSERKRRTGINLSNDMHALAQVGNLVTTMNTKLQRAQDRQKMSGLAKFLSDDLTKVRHDDFDSGVNAMALLCALVLSVPYQVAGTLDYGNLDWMKSQIDECDNFWTYSVVYTGYRLTFIMTVYFSISGMIIATFFFLFKRNNDFDYKLWRSKARYMVILLFFCTAFSIIALILFTNLYFDYYLLSSSDDICNNGTLAYVVGGSVLALLSFVVAFYLIL